MNMSAETHTDKDMDIDMNVDTDMRPGLSRNTNRDTDMDRDEDTMGGINMGMKFSRIEEAKVIPGSSKVQRMLLNPYTMWETETTETASSKPKRNPGWMEATPLRENEDHTKKYLGSSDRF